jgi:glycerophosphoryl diester phosphodiesterase
VFEIQAHRANSEPALRRLLAAGPSSLELDVGVTADGAVVVSHEVRATTLECASSPLLGTPWRKLTAAQARGLGRLTLDEALELTGTTPVVVEAKSSPPHTVGPRDFARALEPYLSRIALCSFDKRVLSHARRLSRDLETTFLFEVPLRFATAARTLGPRADLVTRDLVHAAHSLGMRVVPWTVNDARELHALLELGVDGIVTDQPALLREIVSSAGSLRRRAA